jgi:hypothetical protein
VFNPWFAIARDAVKLGVDAQSVVAMRLGRIAAGGAAGEAESIRMVSEKLEAWADFQVAMMAALWTGQQAPALAREAISIYGKSVRANRRRLSKE